MSRTEADLLDSPRYRRQTARQVRHSARARLHQLATTGDPDALEDADALCPTGAHDLGRRTSPAPRATAKPGRRPGFKVWKTPFWKRRRAMWHERNEAARLVADARSVAEAD